MEIEQNIILDFSHIYPEDIERQVKGLKRIDCRNCFYLTGNLFRSFLNKNVL